MWPFKEQETKEIIKPLENCSCGARSYGALRNRDAVHCNDCGAMYLIGVFVNRPVAKYEIVSVAQKRK